MNVKRWQLKSGDVVVHINPTLRGTLGLGLVIETKEPPVDMAAVKWLHAAGDVRLPNDNVMEHCIDDLRVRYKS